MNIVLGCDIFGKPIVSTTLSTTDDEVLNDL